MLRVLIADDESKVCQLIEKLVDWDALGMEVVAVAENGIEALEKIKEFHPDIVITDIRMPGYDGLDLIRLGKEEAPKAEFVIISGYRHFEYAQMAIRYGVNAYLLKPIKKDELTETLKRLSTRFRVQTEQLSQEEKTRLAIRSDEKNLRQAFLQDLVGRRNKETLSQPLLEINREFHYRFEPGEFCIAILKLDGRVCDEEQNVQFMAEKVQSAAERFLKDYVMETENTELNGFHFFLLNYDAEDRMQIRRQMKALLSEIRVQGDILKNLSVTLALGEGVESLPEISGHEILQMTKEICNQYLFFMKKYRLPVEENFMENFSVSADNCADAAELFDYLTRRITTSYEKAARLKRQDENRPIRVVKKYVEEHFGEPLTLEELSQVVDLSPTYLSTIFKKDTGMTFLEYLSKVRMDMAKKLLKETNDTVADICGKVGYSDVRYFTKTFTKYAGLKPKEYRKLYS